MNRLLFAILPIVLCLGPTTSRAADEPIGRLFFTPQQRAMLDAGRRIATTKTPTQRKSAPRRPQGIELNGIILRSDGSQTVWLNGKAHHDNAQRRMHIEVDPQTPESALVQLPGRPSATLRVGERVNVPSRAPGVVPKDPSKKPTTQEPRSHALKDAEPREPVETDPAASEPPGGWPR